MAKNLVWLSFDLGVQGDYESLYVWLDQHGARECGDSVASFWYEYEHDLAGELKADIQGNIRVTKRTRLYLVRVENGRAKGSFLVGNRRSAPWTGLAGIETGEDTDRG